jgi:hypothetical protein
VRQRGIVRALARGSSFCLSKPRCWLGSFLALWLLAVCGVAAAQASDPWMNLPLMGSSASPRGVTLMLRPSSRPLAVVRNAPFSAEQQRERHEVLPNGAHIDQVSRPLKMWRDSAGRLRMETPPLRYENRDEQGFPYLVVIFDPVLKSEYVLDAPQHIAHRLSVATVEVPPPNPDANDQIGSVDKSANGTVTREPLGYRTIEGLVASGMRTTIESAADAATAERRPAIVAETWHSKDLQLEVMYTCPDRSSADNIRKLTNVVLGEPDPALFQLPPNYSVLEETGQFKITFTRN